MFASFALMAVLLWEARREGPDFGHYFEWGHAALSGDIFELGADILSPGGVPFSLAVAVPGMLFATTYHAVGELMSFRTAAYLTGWAAGMLFWVSAFAALRSAARDNLALAAFGVGGLFVGTHAGFYSFTYSTEVFASAFVAATWAIALCRAHRGVLAAAAVGAFAGLLLLVRLYLVLYALPPLWLVIVGHPAAPNSDRLYEWGGASTGRTPIHQDARGSGTTAARSHRVGGGESMDDRIHVPSAVCLWWIRVPLRRSSAPPDRRRARASVAWAARLSPAVRVAFLALLIGVWRSGPRRLLWAATLGVVLMHLWVQSAWHIWWLGGSFGMRGLAPSALPLILALVATLAQDLGRPGRHAIWWVRVSLIACAWSFLLLLQADGNNGYLTWPELIAGQAPAAAAAGALVVLWAVVAVCRARWNGPEVRTEIAGGALVLLGASSGYLISRAHGRLGATLFLIAAAASVAVFYLERTPRWNRAWSLRIVYVTACVFFVAQTLVFALLAVRTERYLASGNRPPRPFRSVGAVPADDLRKNYVEYAHIPGFEDRKRKLRVYLNWLEIDAATMTPSDRDLAERVLRAMAADPRAGEMFVRVTASNGTVYLTSSDSNEATRKRAVDVAAAVPGVATVEADMK